MGGLINTNPGIVRAVHGATIKVCLPRGGIIIAPNKGFRLGQSVYLIMNPFGTKVVDVMSPEKVNSILRHSQDNIHYANQMNEYKVIIEDNDDVITGRIDNDRNSH